MDEQDSGVVDGLIQGVGVSLGGRHRTQREPVVDRELNLDIAPVVLDELRPTIWVAAEEVPGAATVQHGGCGWRAELFDQLLTRRVLLNVEVKIHTDRIQAHRQTEVSQPHHRAASLVRVKKPACQQLGVMTLQPRGERDPLKRRNVRPLDHARVHQCCEHLDGQPTTTGEIDDLHRAAVDRVAEDEEGKSGCSAYG